MIKGRILIMEDQLIIGEDLRFMLEERGYEVSAIVPSLQRMIEMCAENEPDLIIMDLPLYGEVEAIETARSFRENLGIKVVFLITCSGNSTQGLTEIGPCIEKPYSVEELLLTVQVQLENRKDNSE